MGVVIMGAEFKNIKIEISIKEDLDSIRYFESESYSSIIKRLIEDNKQLKEDKRKLYNIVLASDNAVALVNDVHKIVYFMELVLNDTVTSEAEKLEDLEIYLQDYIKTDIDSVIESIDILKDDLSGSNLTVLSKFENYVKTAS